MENKDLLVIAAAAVAVWMIVKKLPGLTAKAPTATGGAIVNNAEPGEPGWGWDYFDGGVAIGPDGSYKVWSPA